MSDFKKKVRKKLEEIANNNEGESIEDVTKLFKAVKSTIKEENEWLSDEEAVLRTINALDSYYSNDSDFSSGDLCVFIPLGVAQQSRDQNKQLREEILENFSKPNKRQQMAREGKVMVMKISDKEIDGKNVTFDEVYQPVSKIEETVKLDSGEIIVTEGELWKPGDDPIPRDYRSHVSYGDNQYENSQWSQPLYPKWRMQLFGIGYFVGTVKSSGREVNKDIKNSGVKMFLSISGERADPTNSKYLLNRSIMFTPLKMKAVKKDSSNDLVINTWIRRDAPIESSDMDIKTEQIIEIINERVHNKAKKAMSLAKKLKENPSDFSNSKADLIKELYKLYKPYLEEEYKYIPRIDLDEIHDYHMKYAVVRDEDGEVVKNDSGWDVTKFTKFAICQCTLKGVYENEKGDKYVVRDWSLPEDKNIFMRMADGLPTEIPSPSSVLISLQTSRGNQVYDADTKTWMKDPENAKAFAKCKGIKLLRDFNKMSLSKLKGDL